MCSQVRGFKLESLYKLKDTRATTNPKTTLVHFVARVRSPAVVLARSHARTEREGWDGDGDGDGDRDGDGRTDGTERNGTERNGTEG